MKRILGFWLVLVLAMMHARPALAETKTGAFFMDWTQVVIWVIGAISAAVSALLARVWMGYAKPWLEQRGLMDAAGIVVSAVEALLGRYCGEDKWRLALEKMKERGFDADSDAVVDALKAAWQRMDMEQVAAGVKDVEGEHPHGNESKYTPLA